MFLTACLSVEMPDDMISDTIKAGKDVYKDIHSEEYNDMDEIYYTYTYVGKKSDSVDNLVSSCLADMEKDAAVKLEIKNICISNKSHEINIVSNNVIVNCSGSVKSIN